MKNFFTKYSNQINGYIFILPAFLIIGIFGIFPVFFGMYMSVHKWKVFKGRFLGFENYQKILGDISSFWLFILGLLILIFSYWFWSEYKNKFKNKFYVFLLSLVFLIISLILINYSWSIMMSTGDEDFLNSLIYIFYYSFFCNNNRSWFRLINCIRSLSKIKRQTIISNDSSFTLYHSCSNGRCCLFFDIWKS